jgi:hypothetical protein
MVYLRAVDKALRGMPKRIQYDENRIREENMPFLAWEVQCHFYLAHGSRVYKLLSDVV